VTVQARNQASPTGGVGHQPANLGDILERVLDRGVVIVGDIRVSLLDIELLTIKLRLLIASVDTARELGIDWWQHDPWLTSKARESLEDGDRYGRTGRVQEHVRDDRSSRPAAVEAGEPPVIDVEPAPRRHREADRRGRSSDD
jgi:hypothetical protein